MTYDIEATIKISGLVQSKVQGTMIGMRDVLPPVRDKIEGAVIHYTGPTTAEYITGRAYICTRNTPTDPLYWKLIPQIPALPSSRVLLSDDSGSISASTITPTTLEYLTGVTSNIQAQLDSKQGTTTGGANRYWGTGAVEGTGSWMEPANQVTAGSNVPVTSGAVHAQIKNMRYVVESVDFNSAYTNSTELFGYPYEMVKPAVDLAVKGGGTITIQESDYVEVIFDSYDAEMGLFARVCDTANGSITIYSRTNDNTSNGATLIIQRGI